MNTTTKRRAKLYYGFEYRDGRYTTTGGDYGAKIRRAGSLCAFLSAAERDAWVEEGDYRYGHPIRVAVTTRNLPMGWTVYDAVTWNDEFSYHEDVWSDDGYGGHIRFDD